LQGRVQGLAVPPGHNSMLNISRAVLGESLAHKPGERLSLKWIAVRYTALIEQELCGGWVRSAP
jgi:hypothetical protein